MGLKRTDEFRKDVVCIALTSGLTRKQVADDLGVHCPADDCAAICREGDVDAKQVDHGTPTARQRLFTCARGDEHRITFSIERMRRVMSVSSRGLRAFRSRPASRRQRSDLVTLAHIKEQSRLSLASYGRPRMTEELKEIGLNVGHRRVGRPSRQITLQSPAGQRMRQNGISVVRARKHKATADRNHKLNTAPNLLDRDFPANRPNRNWAGDTTHIWTREGWLYLAVILDLHSRRVIGWPHLGRFGFAKSPAGRWSAIE